MLPQALSQALLSLVFLLKLFIDLLEVLLAIMSYLLAILCSDLLYFLYLYFNFAVTLRFAFNCFCIS